MSFCFKKGYKVLIFFLSLSLFLSYGMVKAYSSPNTVSTSNTNLKYQTYSNSVGTYYTKNTTNMNTQGYKTLTASTWLTNPCPNCVIASRVHTDDNGAYSAAITTSINQTKTWTEVTVLPANWIIEQMRFDYTLLTTTSTGTWYLNVNPNA